MGAKQIIITGGRAYADIDVLACASAYAQLLNILGFQANAVITGPWNQTIPLTIRSWPLKIQQHFIPKNETDFVLVDFSDPKYMEEFVSLANVIEVFDHHYGHEKFWRDRIGNSAFIDKVGACATLIWEKFKEHDAHHKISAINANLLYTAIFANTLNFKSNVTQERDKIAAEEISAFTNLPCNWKQLYYEEISKAFESDLFLNISKDTKTIELFGTTFSFGQIELWNADFLLKKGDGLFDILQHRVEKGLTIKDWIVNLVDIEKGKSYLFSNCEILKNRLMKITQAIACTGDLIQTDRLWLRKEILKDLIFMHDKEFR